MRPSPPTAPPPTPACASCGRPDATHVRTMPHWPKQGTGDIAWIRLPYCRQCADDVRGNHSVECRDPVGGPRYINSAAEWRYQVAGIHATWAQVQEEAPIRPVLGATPPLAGRVRSRRDAPDGQMTLMVGV